MCSLIVLRGISSEHPLIIAANPEVEGSTIAERVEALADLDVVIMRAANDDK